MFTIHLVRDEKFINSSFEIFERFYPNKNLFVVDTNETDKKYVNQRDNVIFLPFSQLDWLKIIGKYLIDKTCNVNVIVHYLTENSAIRALELKKKGFVNNLYWIFYGADLYNYLEIKGKYHLYDYNVKGRDCFIHKYVKLLLGRYNYVDAFCSQLNYFCFWNYYDYEILCDNIKTNAKFKLFYYVNTLKKPNDKLFDSGSDFSNILVNNSASYTGNHLTVLNKLSKLGVNNSRIILPLSYGPSPHITLIEKEIEKLFLKEDYFLLKEYLPINTYYDIVNTCQYAVMGHRRQEAGGNIGYLLRSGSKVFLREDNNLLRYYKDLGCFVYSFEKDLISSDALFPLNIDQKKVNRDIIEGMVSSQKIEDMMTNLLKD